MTKMAKSKFYSVPIGRKPDIYTTWDDCQKQVSGFSGAVFKSFPTLHEAQLFFDQHKSPATNTVVTKNQELTKPMFLPMDTKTAPQDETIMVAKNEPLLKTLSPPRETNTASQKEEIVVTKNQELSKPVSLAMETTIASQNDEGPEIYVDGSYNPKTKEYGCGVVVLKNGKLEKEWGFKGDDREEMRNVSGEIKASESAMLWCRENKIEKVTIVHDYEGIAKWCNGQWKAKLPGTQAYKKVYEEIEEKVEVRFRWVRGHSNNEWNDRADKLAKMACGVE